MTDQDESAQLSRVPLYGVVRDVVKNSSDLSGSTAFAVTVAAALNQFVEDGRCPDLHDSIMTVIAFHEARQRINMAELLGTLECIKLQLHEIAFDERVEEAATGRN